MNSAQPDFFIAGAPKAGTTSLCHYLDQHPEIYMSPVKEANHFASEVCLDNFADEHRDRVSRDMLAMQEYLAGPMTEKLFGAVGLQWEDYLKLFLKARQQKAIGEGSVVYLWSESAAHNIFQRIPGARIILILRDPADRAFSQYMQIANKGRAQAGFGETCRQAIDQRGGKFKLFRPFLELGLYADGVKRYLDLFPRENLHIAWYEDYQRDASGTLTRILKFLGVRDDFQPDMRKRYLEGSGGAAMDPQDRRMLTDFYRDDVRKLAQLLNRDLSRWEQ